MLEKALDVVVENGMLLHVEVILQTSATSMDKMMGKEWVVDSIPPLSLYLLPETDIPEIKGRLTKYLGIPEKEQRLSMKGKDLFEGSLNAKTKSRKIKLNLRHVQFDVRLESLYAMVGLEKWEERDEIMGNMVMTRNPGKCSRGHKLIEIDECPEKGNTNEYTCANCKIDRKERLFVSAFMEKIQPFVCEECFFCLCSRCINNDKGYAGCTDMDPYETLATVAKQIGRELAVIGSTFGGRSNFCEYPQLNVQYHLASLVFANREQNLVINSERKALHDGVRVVIRFNEEARSVLQSVGQDIALEKAEIRKTFQNGLTFREVMVYREEWLKVPHLWRILAQELSSRFPACTNHFGEPAEPHAFTRLVSYGLEEVVYEVGVSLDDRSY